MNAVRQSTEELAATLKADRELWKRWAHEGWDVEGDDGSAGLVELAHPLGGDLADQAKRQTGTESLRLGLALASAASA